MILAAGMTHLQNENETLRNALVLLQSKIERPVHQEGFPEVWESNQPVENERLNQRPASERKLAFARMSQLYAHGRLNPG